MIGYRPLKSLPGDTGGKVSPDTSAQPLSTLRAHLQLPPLCSLSVALLGVKWGEFQSRVNVYSLLETLKNKNSS